jgi:hypothetical protein
MPERTPTDWYRLLTEALLGVESRPFPSVNGVALDRVGVTVLFEIKDNAEAIVSEIANTYETGNLTVAHRFIGSITSSAQGGDVVYSQPSHLTGTIACLVQDANMKKYMLTCDHIVGQLAGKVVGDPVFSPHGSQIGTFAKGGTVSFLSGSRNRVDAALIELTNPNTHNAGLQSIGQVAGVNNAPSLGDRTQKYGNITLLTSGDYVYLVSHLVPYQAGSALFVDQLGIDSIHNSPFATGGDSGSLVVDANKNAVGLLFASAVNSNLGFANPIHDVLQAFGVSIV